MSISVAIVEDDAGVRDNLAELVNRAPNMRCVGRFPNGEVALEGILGLKPDIALLDINLPGMNGVQLAAALKPKLPKTQILMLTLYEESDVIFDSLKAGASGYLLKRTAPDELLKAIENLHAGGSPMSPEIARQVVSFFHQRTKANTELENLTTREAEILAQLAKGYLYKEIADRLGLSTETVRWHLRHIYEKLHVHSRTEAVLKFLGR